MADALDLVTNGKAGDSQRLIVMIEKNKSPYKWLLNTYKVSEETNFFYKSAAEFDCPAEARRHGQELLHR